MTPDGEDLVEVWRGTDVSEPAYVLEAVGVPFVRVRSGPREEALLVPRSQAGRATAELAAYLAELSDPRRRERAKRPRSRPNAPVLGALLWSLFVGTSWIAQNLAALAGGDLIERGRLVGDAFARGEFWRPWTALTLHLDAVHFAGNLVFGALLLAALSAVCGPGAALLLALLSGGLANGFEVLLRDADFSSVGASTAVFGALGALVGLRLARGGEEEDGRSFTRLVLVPLGAGLALLAWLGTAGERTDVLAHALGFCFGLPLAATTAGRLPRSPAGQAVSALLALAAPALAWGLAHSFP